MTGVQTCALPIFDQHFAHKEAAVINEIVERFELDEEEIGTMKNIVLRGKAETPFQVDH